MSKSYMVEFYDVENEYMTGKAITAKSAEDAAEQVMEWARRHYARKIVVSRGMTQWLYYVEGVI